MCEVRLSKNISRESIGPLLHDPNRLSCDDGKNLGGKISDGTLC